LMIQTIVKKAGILTITASLVIQFSFLQPKASADAEIKVNTYSDEMISIDPNGKYDHYLENYANKSRPVEEVVVNAETYTIADPLDIEKLVDYEGESGVSVKTGEQGSIQWEVNVPTEGLYRIEVRYYPVKGKSSAIQRSMFIDGKLPFNEAAFIEFHRVWGNEKVMLQQDNNGNDLRPEQIEKPIWQNQVLTDADGFHSEPFSFYFSSGKHTLTFLSQREPMVIRSLKLVAAPITPTYQELANQYKQNGYKAAQKVEIEVQGEQAVHVSSPTLYPLADQSSPAVEPYSASKIKINTIGGKNWRLPGDWIAWGVEVPKTGLYKIGLKVKQNFLKGVNSTRKLMIDGKVPFKEMENIAFPYQSEWHLNVLGGRKDPELFYLTEGKHELRMEVALGDYAELIRNVESTVLKLNAIYRDILMITGSSPDQFRDYQLEKRLPNMITIFKEESQSLRAVSERMITIAGKNSEKRAVLNSMADQLDAMANKPEAVHKQLTSFKINVGALGTWMLQIKEQPLQIDSLILASPDTKMPKGGANFFSKMWHVIATFFYSFVIDYNQIGNVNTSTANDRTIDVWVGSGRDQAQIIKAMIDDSFTPKTGITVNLKLVQNSIILPATLSGNGPDVAMQIGIDIPVNYAMRNAVADISHYPDYAETAKRFRNSALVPFQYNGGAYALPETQTFNMMFYRKDIMKELGLKLPDTWQDVMNMLPKLNKNHLEFGLPQPLGKIQSANANLEPNGAFTMLFLQQGGKFYTDNGKKTGLNTELGSQVFKQWTEFYTDYSLTKEYDFANRFRTGEIPVGVVDYTMYNQLAVFAPEIRGLWGIAPVPGTVQEDGQIRRDAPSGGSAIVMMKAAKDKAASWEFMKWWTNEQAQTKFGREIEGVLGPSARYPTANLEAFRQLPWSVADYNNLTSESKWVQGTPEVPGGYFTGRYLINAFFKVVNSKIDPREAIEESADYIQEEINHKRKEFNLQD
jgi:ABC-type glycerol-3-phosphate transport system substrate-binding protein